MVGGWWLVVVVYSTASKGQCSRQISPRFVQGRPPPLTPPLIIIFGPETGLFGLASSMGVEVNALPRAVHPLASSAPLSLSLASYLRTRGEDVSIDIAGTEPREEGQ